MHRYEKSYKAVLVTGARQVGKSTLFLKRAIKSPKLYFRDTGLVSYLTRWPMPETLAYGAMSGPIFETFVVSEILKSFSNEGLDYRHFVSYYRGRDKKE